MPMDVRLAEWTLIDSVGIMFIKPFSLLREDVTSG